MITYITMTMKLILDSGIKFGSLSFFLRVMWYKWRLSFLNQNSCAWMGHRKDCIFEFNDMPWDMKDIKALFHHHNQFSEDCQGISFVGIIRTKNKISHLLAQQNNSVWNKSQLDTWLQMWSSNMPVVLYQSICNPWQNTFEQICL